MKIRSRPPEIQHLGNGAYALHLSFEELQLIGAYVFVTRLGAGSVYKRAAFNLIKSLDEMFDDDFTMESADDVGLTVSHVDPNDTIINTLTRDEIVLEVT